jgi:hypothetical protein
MLLVVFVAIASYSVTACARLGNRNSLIGDPRAGIVDPAALDADSGEIVPVPAETEDP